MNELCHFGKETLEKHFHLIVSKNHFPAELFPAMKTKFAPFTHETTLILHSSDTACFLKTRTAVTSTQKTVPCYRIAIVIRLFVVKGKSWCLPPSLRRQQLCWAGSADSWCTNSLCSLSHRNQLNYKTTLDVSIADTGRPASDRLN